MAFSEFVYLDGVGIEEELLQPQLDNTKSLDYRQQLNLGVNTAQAENTLARYNDYLYELVKDKEITFTILNRSLESFLNLLLTTSFISNLDATKLSSHYSRRKLTVLDNFIKPSSSYLETLLYTSRKVWGGKYGTVAYFNYIRESWDHYIHPSHLSHLLYSYCFNEFKVNQINSTKVETFINNLIYFIDNEEQNADTEIYNQSYLIFGAIDLNSIISLLTFLQKWLPFIIEYYLNYYRESNTSPIIFEEGTNTYYAWVSIQEIAKACIKLGIDTGALNEIDLVYEFIHQSIPAVYFNLVEEIISIRKRTEFLKNTSTKNEVELYLNEFIEAIPLNVPSNLLRDKSLFLLNDFFPPGGYNLYLLLLSLVLINRAYILTFPTNHQFKDYIIRPIRNYFQPVVELLGRVSRLIYFSGYVLKKSNLDHLQIIGDNLITLSALEEEDNNSESTSLLNILE